MDFSNQVLEIRMNERTNNYIRGGLTYIRTNNIQLEHTKEHTNGHTDKQKYIYRWCPPKKQPIQWLIIDQRCLYYSHRTQQE